MGGALSFISKLNVSPPESSGSPVNDPVGPFLIILGAGASVSSGLKTYRGKNGIYPENSGKVLCADNLYRNPRSVWDEINHIVKSREGNKIGSTYHHLKEFHKLSPNSMFLTQNVDGFIRKVGIDDGRIWEMHGQLRTMTCLDNHCPKRIHNTDFDYPVCPECNNWCRPDVILFGETLEREGVDWVSREIKRVKPKYVIVVGITMSFPYIAQFIQQAKKTSGRSGCLVISVNPDPKVEFPIPQSIDFCADSDDGLKDILDIFKRNM